MNDGVIDRSEKRLTAQEAAILRALTNNYPKGLIVDEILGKVEIGPFGLERRLKDLKARGLIRRSPGEYKTNRRGNAALCWIATAAGKLEGMKS